MTWVAVAGRIGQGVGKRTHKATKSIRMISLVWLYKLLSVSLATAIIKRLILNKYWFLLKTETNKQTQNTSLNMRVTLTKILDKK